MGLVYKSYVGGNSYCYYDYLWLFYYDYLYELAKMSLLGWHPKHLVENKDTLWDQHWQQTVFLDFYKF